MVPDQVIRRRRVRRVVVVVLLSLLALGDPRPGARRLVRWALPLSVVPPTILLAVSQFDALYVPRYVLFSLVGMPLLAAQGMDSLARAVRGALRLGVSRLWRWVWAPSRWGSRRSSLCSARSGDPLRVPMT